MRKEMVYVVIVGVGGRGGLYSGGTSPARWLGGRASGSGGVVRCLVGVWRIADGTST